MLRIVPFGVAAVLAGLLLAGSVQAADGALPVFAAEDIFALEYADHPRVSPVANQVVYERRSNNIMTDRTGTGLWLLDVDQGSHQPLLSGPEQVSSPRWSPDGGRLAWLTQVDDQITVQVHWLASGRTADLATLPAKPKHLSWSPDGRWLAYVMSVPEPAPSLVKAAKPPAGATWAEPVQLVASPIYRWDGRGMLEPFGDQIFLLPAEGGSPRQLTSGPFRHRGPLAWTPDGSRILFSANRNHGWEFQPGERNLWQVWVADGTLQQITDQPGDEYAPAVSPDGRHIAFLYDHNAKQPYRNRLLKLMAADGSNQRSLGAGLDRSVAALQWQPDSRQLLFSYDDQARRKVARINLAGHLEDLTDQLGGTTLGRPYLGGSWHLGADQLLAFTLGRPDRPADVAVLRLGRRGGGKVSVLTALNEDLLGHRQLAALHELNYPSAFDGTPIQGWYLTPPGFDPARQYPLILEIHGGPHLAYGPQFSAELQRYAAEGFVVFYANHRGSTSYGEEFALKLQNRYASPEDFADHNSGVDAMIGLGFIDPEQLYITGGSAGGIASAYAIGLTDRFRAAAIAKPVINWLSKTLTGDGYINQIHYQFPAPPWEAFDHYWRRSPLSLVGNVVTPTLLITGEEDLRTPISETEQFYQALQLRGVETVMVRVPGSPHGIAGRPSRMIAKSEHVLAWFRNHAPTEPAGSATEPGPR